MSGEVVELTGDRLTIAVAPAAGGSLVSARYRRGDEDVLLTRTLRVPLAEATASHLTSFPMAPFANRIDAGRFAFGGRDIALPINRPAQGVAIHGVARNRAWRVVRREPGAVELAIDFAEADYAFAFEARQRFEVKGDAFTNTLVATNTGGAPMPFGIGMHPYFRRTSETVVRFRARGYFPVDEARNLPLPPTAAADASVAEQVLAARDCVGLDRHYFGWAGAARVEWPDLGLAMAVEGDAVLANAHLYFSPEEASVCVEPVSHVPDVHNHREWSGYGDYRVLMPGESIAGTMTCRVMRLG